MTGRNLNLYFDRPHRTLDVDEIQGFLHSLGLKSYFRGDFYRANKVDLDEVSMALAGLRIRDLNREDSLNVNPVENDVSQEKSILKFTDPIVLERDFSNIYSGFHLARLLRRYVGSGLHIIFTSRLPATFEGTRYHGRVIVADFPVAVVSTTGIVEAPARPREYYIRQAAYHRAQHAGLPVPEEPEFMQELEEGFKEGFIGYDDTRMTEVVKGCTLQAAFYLIFGEVFCQNPGCRLYNAHTQKEMIYAQIESGMLCKHHQAMLEDNFSCV